jgi:hypothetical protein
MTIHVSKDAENAINAAVQSGLFASATEMIDTLVRDFAQRIPRPPAAGMPQAEAHKPIWEEILELTADVPEEEWDKLPVDASEQHDHYIYGTPKRPAR